MSTSLKLTLSKPAKSSGSDLYKCEEYPDFSCYIPQILSRTPQQVPHFTANISASNSGKHVFALKKQAKSKGADLYTEKNDEKFSCYLPQSLSREIYKLEPVYVDLM